MIFQFPDYDTLKLALTSGVVPAEVSLAPTVAGVDAKGRPWLEASLDKRTSAQLTKLGVTRAEAPPLGGEDLQNWLQALPLVRDSKSTEIEPNREVIFELPDAARLPEVVGEMLRLNVDRQGFRWLDTGGVLLRVIGPPYYTLLRAIDRDTSSGVRAYVEQAPRVWVEIGQTHPLVGSIAPPEGEALFLRPPRDWVRVAEAPFRDIYEILDFRLPRAKFDWQAKELRKKLIVPLRLVEGDRHDAELWVLRDDPVARLDALVRDAREGLVQRLIFAVGEHEGKPVIVLRVRPSKLPPPQLVLEAEAYEQYLKLDNLFVPVGTRIHPVLRRDAVRRLLADDPGQMNWLRPDPAKRGGFLPERLPDSAFRPLADWVDYVLDRDREALSHWVGEFKFDFDPFVCPEEEAPAKARAPKRSRAASREGPPRLPRIPKAAPAEPESEVVEAIADDFAEIVATPPSKLQVELAQLQDKFLALEGGLDDAARLRLWPEMAARHAALNQGADAGLCWMNLLWELLDLDAEAADLKSETSAERKAARQARLDAMSKLVEQLGGEAELARQWLRGEGVLPEPKLTWEKLDAMLANEQPSYGEVRGLVAGLVWGAYDPAASKVIVSRLPKVQQYLERHERVIGLRPVWLGRHALAKLSRDALALARVRDRLIERLVTEGYSAERELPGFLRAAGHADRERTIAVHGRLDELRELAIAWCSECGVGDRSNVRQTSENYVNLIFAFGSARMGEPLRARELLRGAEAAVAAMNKVRTDLAPQAAEVADFFVRGYRYRIEQVLAGRPHAGPLPAEMLEYLEQTFPREATNTTRFVLDRRRDDSRILEPQERVAVYRNYHRTSEADLERQLTSLPSVLDAQLLRATVRDLIKSAGSTTASGEDLLKVLAEALMLSPRVGEAFAAELLARVEPALDRATPRGDSSDQLTPLAVVLERALAIAGNYDRVDVTQRLWPRFVELLQRSNRARSPSESVNRLFGQCLRSMRKLGLRDDIARMVGQAERLLVGGKSVASLRSAAGRDWPHTVTTLLHLAGGWLTFGRYEEATEVFNAAREILYTPESRNYADGIYAPQFATLAIAYATALGQAPIDFALQRAGELFRKMRRLRDQSTPSRYYSRIHLNIIEAVVLALVSDDFALGPSARRWMDDDEYLIRRRIHRDHRVMLAQG